MTVETAYAPKTYKPGAAMAAERIPFQYDATASLIVTHIAEVTGLRTVLVNGTDFILAGDGMAVPPTGTIAATAVWPADDLFEIRRGTERRQRKKFPPSEPLPSRDLQAALDRDMMVVQEQDATLLRAPLVPLGEVAYAVPAKAQRAGKVQAWDANGGEIAIGAAVQMDGADATAVRRVLNGIGLLQQVMMNLPGLPAMGEPIDEGRLQWEAGGAIYAGDPAWQLIKTTLGYSDAQMAALLDAAAGERLNYATSLDPSSVATLMALFAGAGGSGLIGTPFGRTLAQHLLEERRRSVLEFMTPTEQLDVLSGAPVLDVAAAFQACVDWCSANQYEMYIPYMNARLGARIEQTPALNVRCDSDAHLRWFDVDDCGWSVVGTGMARPGYAVVELPFLIGPHSIAGYEDGSYTYSLDSFVGGSALDVTDCIWSDFRYQRAVGWEIACRLGTDVVPTDNNRFDLGTIDMCRAGIVIDSPVGTLKGVGQSSFRTLNIFARFPIVLNGKGAGVFECDIEAVGLLVNEAGGRCISFNGDDISDMRIRCKAFNGYIPDSPVGTDTDMVGPLLGGDGLAGAETDWAVGTRNRVVFENIDDFEPVAGNPVVIKLRGPGSSVEIVTPRSPASAPYASVALSATQGEVHYNGGVGGAAVHELTRVNVTVTALAAGAQQIFYFYHQRLNADNILPAEVVGIDNSTSLHFRTDNNGPTVAREVKVTVLNPTAGPISQTVNLWLRV